MLSQTPPGYKVAYQAHIHIGIVLEMIPEGETLADWTEMLTVQVIRNIDNYTLDSFHADMKAGWADMCPCGSTQIIERGLEGALPTLFWSHKCPMNKRTHYPENVWFKVLIQGGNIVIVQKAFKFDPPETVATLWLEFMRDLRVDHRLDAVH